MKWEEIKNLYPNQWVKINILQYHIDDNKKFIDDMEVVNTIDSDLEAGRG